MTQSKQLTEFYNAYNDWLEAGAPERVRVVKFLPWITKAATFTRYNGLCINLSRWAKSIIKADNITTTALVREQEALFHDAGLSRYYPFDALDYANLSNTSYNLRSRIGTVHECPKRIAWVKAHLA